MRISKKIQKHFIRAARQIARQNLVSCGSGNLSWRVEHDYMLITTSGSWMSEVSEDTISLCRIHDGSALTANKPSVEIGFHRTILHKRPEIDVVLHFQSPYATTLACWNVPNTQWNIIPEIPYYIGQIATVPYLNPGSDELAQAVTSAMLTHNLVILQNHGQVTAGKNFREAFQRAIFFELACKILVHAGNQVQTLSEEAVAFLDRTYKKR